MSELNEVARQVKDIFEKDKGYFEDVKWSCFSNKYMEEVLGFKDNWIFQVSNLVDESLTDHNLARAKEMMPFYSWLGERIALCLNLNRGETNEQLKLEWNKINEQKRS